MTAHVKIFLKLLSMIKWKADYASKESTVKGKREKNRIGECVLLCFACCA